MVGKDNDGRATHGRHKADSMRSILQHTCNIWRTAADTGTQNYLTFWASRAQMCACLQLLPATFPSNQGFIRVLPGEKQAATGQNRA